MRVFVTGGTGLVGRRLVRRLVGRGDEVVVLSRSADGRRLDGVEAGLVRGDPVQPGDWQRALAECDAVVNLAGENLMARRWNAEHKRRLRDSRVLATRNVVDAVGQSGGRCRTLVSASAIGYYGPRGDEPIDESAGPGDGFLANLCAAWEVEARRAADRGAREVRVRIGVVLDAEGGALAQLAPVFRRFVGGPVGSGRQWLSWVHHADLTGVFALALDDETLGGPVNATAPNPVTNREFARALGRALKRPSLLRVPGWVLRVGVGQAAETVLASQRVLPRTAIDRGYRFQFDDVHAALANLLTST